MKEAQAQYGVLGIELYCTDLRKFVEAQEQRYGSYQTALAEMQQGRKTSHWIWYIFPQIRGLGRSGTSDHYGIRDLREARDYYEHPVLGARLTEISEVLLQIPTDDPGPVFGFPDTLKVRSCMTLFHHAAPEQEVFRKVLDKFYNGAEDQKTVRILHGDR
ncbi:MAG: DUF1810 domain-containing protein [Oscillospiraceae bacterium]|nr:DUF1810 domain-containing protein [Oscillospiraceae bacterium]